MSIFEIEESTVKKVKITYKTAKSYNESIINNLILSHNIQINGYSLLITKEKICFGCRNMSFSDIPKILEFLETDKLTETYLLNKETKKKLTSKIVDTTDKYYILENGMAKKIDDYEKETKTATKFTAGNIVFQKNKDELHIDNRIWNKNQAIEFLKLFLEIEKLIKENV